MIIYQFSNSIQIILIIFFSILLLVSIAGSILALPLVKLVFQTGNSIKAKILLLPIIIVIYLLCFSLLIFSAKSILQYYSVIRETNIDNCSVATGVIEELEKTPQYARGANLTSYHLKLKLGDSEYYIDTDVGVTLENIDLWNEGDCITIYYQNIDGKNSVVRATKEP